MRLLTVCEAARATRRTPAAIRRLCDRGQLQHLRDERGRRLIYEAEVGAIEPGSSPGSLGGVRLRVAAAARALGIEM